MFPLNDMNDAPLKHFIKLALLLMLPAVAFAQPQTVQFGLPTFTVAEDGTNAIVVVTRTGGSEGTILVNYNTVDGSAFDVQDYVGTSGVLTFNSNEVVKVISIPIVDNTIQEDDEFLTVILTDPVGATISDPGIARVIIFDDDTTLGFDQVSYQISDSGTNAILTIQRAPPGTATACVDVFSFDVTATNRLAYSAAATNIVFTNGQTTAFLIIPILDDCAIETNNETATVVLANPIGAKIGAQGTATLVIVSDDTGA